MERYKQRMEIKTIKKLNKEYFEKSENDFYKTASVWVSGDFTHVCFNSPGCSMRKNGSCIMCNYGKGYKLKACEAEIFLRSFVKTTKASEILFGTCGSIFDSNEISEDVLELICKYSRDLKASTIIFETHCNTINDDILSKLSRWTNNEQEISIEMGFETSNEFLLNEVLCKNLNLKTLEEAISIIHKHKMKAILNILFGIPFLTEEEQIKDVINSINWAEQRGADRIVIFPLNIKKNTYLYELYKKGEYKQVSHRQLLNLLRRIYALGREGQIYDTLELSWYGNRKNEAEVNSVIYPDEKGFDRDKLMKFYENFISSKDKDKKRKLLEFFGTDSAENIN